MNKVTTFTPESPVVALPATARIGEHVMSAFDPQSACDERTAWLFPGLGCRYVGMGHDLIGRHPVADQLIAAAEARLPYSISEVCLEGSGRKYVPPRQEAQVIYVLDCAYAAVLRDRGHQPAVIAGHSLGSLAAGHAAGAYDFMTGLELVTRIEDLMEESIDGHGQAMGVVIGLDEPAICKLLQDAPGTAVANWNSPLQHVLGGPATNVDHALKLALQRGAKQARRFAFERAMHTPLMESVAVRFRESLADITWNDPEVPFVDSHDASVLRTDRKSVV